MAEYNKSMPIRYDVTTDVERKTLSIGTTAANITFSQDLYAIEIANHSNNAVIYLEIDGSTATTSGGIPIYPRQYYSANKKIRVGDGIGLISDKPNTDVRVRGHFELEPENI